MEKITPKNKFGLIIRERIKQFGYKEYEFADKLGISAPSLSRYISGKSLPDYQTAIKICDALQLNLYDIDSMDLDKMKKDTENIFSIRKEFEKLGILEKGQDLSPKQLDLLRSLILSNKAMFQVIDKLITAEDLDITKVISQLDKHVDES